MSEDSMPGAFNRKLARAAAMAAMALVGCGLVGCHTDNGGMGQNPGSGESGNGVSSANSPSVQSSDMTMAPGPRMMHSAMAFPTGSKDSSDLWVVERGPSEVRAGEAYHYSITATNLTDATLTGVTLEQTVPGDFHVMGGGATMMPPKEGSDRAMSTINIGTLAPKQSKTVDLSGTVSHAGMLDTCLSAHYNPPLLCAHVNIVAPALMASANGPGDTDVCQPLTYHYTVTNTGTGVARGVILEENLPQGLMTTDGQKTVMAKLGDILQGQHKDVTAHVRASVAGKYTTQAIVRSNDAGTVNAPELTTNVLAPKLAVTVAGPKEQYIGQPLVYKVTVRNDGNAPAMMTHVSFHAMAPNVQFVSAMGADGGAISDTKAAADQSLGTLASGETKMLSITFNSSSGGSFELDASAAAQCAVPVTTPVTTNVMGLPASAIVVTHDPDPVMVGSDVVYRISLENKGMSPDSNVVLKAMIPDSESYVRGEGDTGVTADGSTVAFGPVTTLAPKQVMHWMIETKAMKPDEAQFKVSMTSDSTTTPAVKIEPTKLFGGETGEQTKTNVAPTPATNTPPTPPPPPTPAPQ
jgi:uncharacterized repeat protein (TIGR01451 family)